MRRNIAVALVSLGLLGTAACDNFLTNSSKDPNRPTDAPIRQVFVGVQAAQFAFQEGTTAMQLCLWVQACGAANGRFVQQAYNYVFGEGTDIGSGFGDWLLVYAAGGLIDIRKVEADALAAKDSTWLGIAKIWEALAIGTASDLWGDIPYSQALVDPQPTLDGRFAVLGAVQTLLSDAIRLLGSGEGDGPGGADLVFGGDADSWIAAANTLKARYWMHLAEAAANGLLPGVSPYDSAITYASDGISDPSGASDFASFHTLSTSERNMWAQFQTSSGFGNDLSAGKEMVDFMVNRRDPRLSSYFCKNVTATWKGPDSVYVVGRRVLGAGFAQQVTIAGTGGATQPTWNTTVGGTTPDGTVTWTNQGLPYAGDDPSAAQPNVSRFSCQPARFGDDARIPYVSYAENELILAEAYQQTGDDPTALTHLNNARAFANGAFSHASPLVDLPTLAGITSANGLLDSIMTEKYVAMFQNIESYSDYRRTCIPALTPATNNRGFTNVPGRLYYPLNERNTDPNIPDPSVQQTTNGFRNAGDAHGCLGDAR